MGLFSRLVKWAQSDFLADSEAESGRQGYLSYRAEWHAAAWGISVGVLYVVTGKPLFITLGVGWLFTRGVDSSIPEYVPYPSQLVNESLYVIGHTTAVILINLTIRYLPQALELVPFL